jgi:hypothetical protein|nr:MAG TPA: hypothetical protein [Caudoviricetes sp.]
MIDIENELITGIQTSIKNNKYQRISSTVSPVVVAVNPQFSDLNAVIHLRQIDNISYQPTATSEEAENHALITYEINVFNAFDLRSLGVKETTKLFMRITDEYMLSIGFTRLTMSFIPNYSGDMHRMVARYQAVVSKDNTIFRR